MVAITGSDKIVGTRHIFAHSCAGSFVCLFSGNWHRVRTSCEPNTAEQMGAKVKVLSAVCARKRVDGSEVIKRDRPVIQTEPRSKLFKFRFEGFCCCGWTLLSEAQCDFFVSPDSQVLLGVIECCLEKRSAICSSGVTQDERRSIKDPLLHWNHCMVSESTKEIFSRQHLPQNWKGANRCEDVLELHVGLVLAKKNLSSREQRNSSPRRNIGSFS